MRSINKTVTLSVCMSLSVCEVVSSSSQELSFSANIHSARKSHFLYLKNLCLHSFVIFHKTVAYWPGACYTQNLLHDSQPCNKNLLQAGWQDSRQHNKNLLEQSWQHIKTFQRTVGKVTLTTRPARRCETEESIGQSLNILGTRPLQSQHRDLKVTLTIYILTFSQRYTNGLVLCFPSIANAALAI